MFDRQKFYNDSFRGMHKQDWVRSGPPDRNACLYAGPNGTGCAIGVNIPRNLAIRMDKADDADDTSIAAFLSPEGEPNSVLQADVEDHLTETYGGPITHEDVRFLADLQVAHDGNALVEHSKPTDRLIRFIQTAKAYDLTPLPLTTD